MKKIKRWLYIITLNDIPIKWIKLGLTNKQKSQVESLIAKLKEG